MTAPIIRVDHLSKAFTVYNHPRDLIKEALLGGVRHDLFWALRDVSFDVHEGDRVGIIGANGAGKSTLLKLISGNLHPSAGSVTVDGKVSAMLSLTSFLNPEETGLQNIRFSLIVNGAPAADIPLLTEEIVDFTELGAFVHAPVRTYSSGMQARLSFAISTSITPDILVVDEVLGAGDAYFAAKATVRMIDLCKQGRALLFVSHAMNVVQLLCTRAIWIDGGVIRAQGPVDEVAYAYETHFRAQEDVVLREGNQARRARLANRVLPLEFEREDVARLRLVGPGGRIADTHYVRAIELDVGGRHVDVGLDFQDIDDDGVLACLDVVHSEWGRSHNRRGAETRVLAQSSSALRGGNILVRAPARSNGSAPVQLAIESASHSGAERLTAQAMHPELGEWLDLELVGEQELADGWTRRVFQGPLGELGTAASAAQLDRLIEESRPDAELLDVTLRVDGREAVAVRERIPFSIAVRVRANRRVERLDAILKVTRSDGFYVFWQTSGQAGVFADDVVGERTFVFDFDPNVFGAADYEVTVDLGNGFDVDTNFPHSEIYDRRVNALRFTVAREWTMLNFGPINHVFPVRIEDG